ATTRVVVDRVGVTAGTTEEIGGAMIIAEIELVSGAEATELKVALIESAAIDTEDFEFCLIRCRPPSGANDQAVLRGLPEQNDSGFPA
ncbi:MAG: hypothetical protein ACREDR_25585, partial [Blastocatellia bacterium]